MRPSNVLDPRQASYEDLLSLWADLETALSRVLVTPLHVKSFETKVRQLQLWMEDLLSQDMDTGLYLLFQLAATSSTGYSAAHALVCTVLCQVAAMELGLPEDERNALVPAAMTMNIAMTELQNELAEQETRPTQAQMEAVRAHSARGCMLLAKLGVSNERWLDVVSGHHDDSGPAAPLASLDTTLRLSNMLKTIDRYAAMISPRRSRQGRSVAESLREVVQGPGGRQDETGLALVRAVGLCPPGTFVRLESRETAVVLRRGSDGKNPIVAILQDARGQAYSQPRLHRTEFAAPRVQSALSHAAAGIVLNHYVMVQLGLYAAQQSRTI